MEGWISPIDAGRQCALESAFGKIDELVTHAVVPFEFGFDAGGRAHVYHFSHYVDGRLSITASLIGCNKQKLNSLGNYELAICEPRGQEWGSDLIATLAYYTLDAVVEPLHTMDIEPPSPDSSIRALLFDSLATFDVDGARCGVLLCLGITTDELNACKEGRATAVLTKLKCDGVYPITDLARKPLSTRSGGGFVSRLFGK